MRAVRNHLCFKEETEQEDVLDEVAFFSLIMGNCRGRGDGVYLVLGV